MRVFIRRLFSLRKQIQRPFTSSTVMSSSSTAAILYAATISPASVTGQAPEEAREKRHHISGGFTNPWDSWKEMSGPTVMRHLLARKLKGQMKVPDTKPPTVHVRKPEFLPTRETQILRATWLGHACYLVEFPGGLRVLFDPVFTERCSPFSWLGPKRYTEIPCQIDDIPLIDAVVISHNHYDHLSLPTIARIKAKHPNAHYFAPLGNKKLLNEAGIQKVTELDWWEERDLSLEISSEGPSSVAMKDDDAKKSEKGGIHARIGCLPCQHTSARTAFDKGHTLWSSWSVESGNKKVWFGGDTGYRAVPELPAEEDDYGSDKTYPRCPAFKDIGDLRGPFDLGLIPIGAYDPRWLFSPMHANPFDSVEIFKDTRCKRAMGIHWGTWVLTEEDVLEPPHLLKNALAKSNLPVEGTFDVCDIGEAREF